MKKKKLFASLTALCVAVCAMVVGIYAAASANVSVNGIISYTALGNVKASLELSHALTPADKANFKAGSGEITATKTVNSGSQTGAENVTDGTATTAAKININGTETDVTGDFALGNIEIEAAQGFADAISYAYTLKITNNYTAEELAENKGLKISFTQPTATNLGITYQSGYTWTDLKSGETVIGKSAILAAGAVATIVVTFSTSADVSGAANLASSIALEAVSAAGESVSGGESGGETEKDYTVKTYAAAERPVQELTNIQYNGTGTATNWFEHYVEMGEYPQRYAGTTSTISATWQGEYFVDNADGSKRYATRGPEQYYLVEPVKWIVVGVTDGVYEGGTHVLFTTTNKAESESSGTGLWLYDSATNSFKYRTTAGNAWTTATEVLVLSEYSLWEEPFHSNTSQNGRFANSTIRNTLNTTLYNSIFTAYQKTKIAPKKMGITTYYQNLNSTADAGVEYNLFLLGSPLSWNGDTFIKTNDSYNLSTYFSPENKGAGQRNLAVKETSYSKNSTATSPDGYETAYCWLRSGTLYYSDRAMVLLNNGYVNLNFEFSRSALRPAFVLNLA